MTTGVRNRIVSVIKYAHTVLWLHFNLCCWYLQNQNSDELILPVLFNYSFVKYWNCQFCCCCSLAVLEMEKKFIWVNSSDLFIFFLRILTFIKYQGKLNAKFNMASTFNKSEENLEMKNQNRRLWCHAQSRGGGAFMEMMCLV